MDALVNPRDLLDVALREARTGLAEGGIPIGAAIFTREGKLLGAGRNRRVQHGDPSAHGKRMPSETRGGSGRIGS
jgi:cytosine deaminase